MGGHRYMLHDIWTRGLLHIGDHGVNQPLEEFLIRADMVDRGDREKPSDMADIHCAPFTQPIEVPVVCGQYFLQGIGKREARALCEHYVSPAPDVCQRLLLVIHKTPAIVWRP